MKELRPQDKARLGSKEWRIEHFYKIKNKQKQLVTFKKNKAQRDFDKNKHSRNIILKSRQLGFTTLEAMDMLDDTLFTRNMDCLFIAQDLDTAKDIFDNKIKLAWDNFVLADKYESDLNSARKLKVGFGDGTSSSIAVDSSGRAGTYHRLHITEFARLCRMFPDKAKEVLEGSIPAVPTDGRVDIESTADGSDGLFYDLFWNAWDKGEPEHKTQFKAHFYNWRWDEEIETTQEIEVPKEFRAYQEKFNLTEKEISFFIVFQFRSVSPNDRNLR